MELIKLPDYLPSRFKSWLQLYVHINRILTEQGITITEDLKIRFSEYLDAEEMKMFSEQEIMFYHEFPLTIIKARAFDELLASMPDFQDFIEIQETIYLNSRYLTNEQRQAFNKFCDVFQQLKK